jgi:hypothetical protein
MKYKKEDLDYIFIRAKNSFGKWDSLSLNEITDEQFVEWAEKRFKLKIEYAEPLVDRPWSKKDKIDFLNDMSQSAGDVDIVCMIKREARKDLNLTK